MSTDTIGVSAIYVILKKGCKLFVRNTNEGQRINMKYSLDWKKNTLVSQTYEIILYINLFPYLFQGLLKTETVMK